jgi:hypothetical protein
MGYSADRTKPDDVNARLPSPVGTETSWNEGRYVDFWDAEARIGSGLRIGMRPNEGHAEISAETRVTGPRFR